MDFDQRQERGHRLCQRLAGRIADVAPRGIGHWDRAWEIVDGPSAAYVIALTSWEADPSDLTMQRVTDTYERVVEAWRQAAAEYAEESQEA